MRSYIKEIIVTRILKSGGILKLRKQRIELKVQIPLKSFSIGLDCRRLIPNSKNYYKYFLLKNSTWNVIFSLLQSSSPSSVNLRKPSIWGTMFCFWLKGHLGIYLTWHEWKGPQVENSAHVPRIERYRYSIFC